MDTESDALFEVAHELQAGDIADDEVEVELLRKIEYEELANVGEEAIKGLANNPEA